MFDYATSDLVLAIAHHVLVFALAGIIAFELAAVRPGLAADTAVRVARVDAWYGVLAAAIVVVGVLRLAYAAKGWPYYEANPYFWAKMAAFAVVGLLSIAPTMAFVRWRRSIRANPAFTPQAAEVARIRRFLWIEGAVFMLIPIFAAAMARIT